MTKLSVNLNKIALLRNSRRTGVPDLAHFAKLAYQAGADGLTIHPRPDQRHIRNSDVGLLQEVIEPFRPKFELNMEGRPTEGFVRLVEQAKPEQCTLVPDADDVLTSDKGFELTTRTVKDLQPMIHHLQGLGCRVILFVDPVPEAVSPVPDTGADGVEFYTGDYSAAAKIDDCRSALANLAQAARRASELQLVANAGHDLNQANIPALIAACPNLWELSIGHELIADALEAGFFTTVRNYISAIAAGKVS